MKEKKAWSSNMNSLKNQMHFTTMGYNLMRVFEEVSKIQKPELIHPSDKKYVETRAKVCGASLFLPVFRKYGVQPILNPITKSNPNIPNLFPAEYKPTADVSASQSKR